MYDLERLDGGRPLGPSAYFLLRDTYVRERVMSKAPEEFHRKTLKLILPMADRLVSDRSCLFLKNLHVVPPWSYLFPFERRGRLRDYSFAYICHELPADAPKTTPGSSFMMFLTWYLLDIAFSLGRLAIGRPVWVLRMLHGCTGGHAYFIRCHPVNWSLR